ncbi:cache domain-containing protein [Poseidonibacter lekithochrous]|uniref:cache domain-containing protein n=1 Tax=Poseidonibacter TaxID=2321187 RepID=UPI001C09AB16|nr:MULTISPECIES: cache domain-containing protein [Poseidonibacter]MBU3015904.1 cache domain-containing protein [Poseidonibacter lekithochrous]MDO6829203.1 cache domain-containing protein [Poseidonibacter sp. 1_MG-2023]
MKLITEKNLSKIIIYIFIIIMSSMIFMITYFYVKNTYENFENEMKIFKKEYYEIKKKTLKKELDTVIDVFNYNITKDYINDKEQKNEAIRLLNNIRFEKNRSNYFFVYDIKNMNGGDGFATLLVNPNRPDIVGSLISTNYEDDNGKKFREIFLKDIREKKESYTQYTYKKPGTTEIKQKLSYFKYYENWNWVLAVGVYTDDIEKEISLKRELLEARIKKQVGQNVVLFIMFLSLAILISIVVSQKIDEVLKTYEEKVKAKTQELKNLNKSLENKVKEELEKNREKEQLLVQKSKFIALGEMISNIAHQWRQPLSELSSILMYIKFKHSINKLDDKTMQIKAEEADKVLDYMSHTIDDFRNFFMPKKEKEEFFLYKAIDSVMTIVSSSLKSDKINVEINLDKNTKLNTYLNEYEQVILNILKNAKDALIEKNIKNPSIKITAYEELEYVVLFIEDNAGGITVEPKGKIFEPYFTTKDGSNGTGIGLYMSKIIIDKNMKGKLRVRNTKNGAKFGIHVPRSL